MLNEAIITIIDEAKRLDLGGLDKAEQLKKIGKVEEQCSRAISRAHVWCLTAIDCSGAEGDDSRLVASLWSSGQEGC